VSNVDLQWADPGMAGFNERMAAFSRLVMYDKAGTGLSDPVPAVPTLEQRMADLGAVLDAVGTDRPVLFGISEGAPMSLLYAATYPDRVRGLILFGALVCGRQAPDNPAGARWDSTTARLRICVENWGEGHLIELFSPTLAGAPLARRFAGIHERAMASPAMAKAAFEAVLETDIRDVLPTIRVPTLVLHRIGDAVPIEGARYLAKTVPSARLIELPGSDHYWWVGEATPIADAIEEFVTGEKPERESDRMLATVLFTDIVGSTERAAALGDATWRLLLEQHNALTHETLASFRGRVVTTTGDGFLAVFDGPARGVRCARALVEAMRELGLEIRAGLHSGECERIGEDNIGGLAVHIGARISALAAPGEVLVSSTVRDLVAGAGIEFESAGEHELKGVPGTWSVHRVVTAPTAGAREREPVPVGSHPIAHASPPLSQRALIATMRRWPALTRRVSLPIYRGQLDDVSKSGVTHGGR
jgi:class 3 adenylate cyclase